MSIARASSLLLVTLCCCGEDSSPCGSCTTPFSCIEEQGTFRCGSPPDAVITCNGSPADQVVPFDATTTGHTIHWVSGDCIAVSHEAAASEWVPYINAAAATWTAVACSSVCVSATATPSEARIDPKDAERRIHVRKVAPETLVDPAATEVFYEEATGRVVGVEISIGTLEAGREGPSLLQLFGHALGLEKPKPNADSVLWSADTISAADVTALCTLYGTPPYCGE